jgi:hypothetical protein
MRLLILAAFVSCAVPLVAWQVKLGEPEPPREEQRARAVESAKAHLAETLKLPAKEIVLESAKETKWPDASLGCPEKDRMYAQVVTPGWTVVLKAGGRTHEVHVAGKRAVSCPAKQAPGEAGGR